MIASAGEDHCREIARDPITRPVPERHELPDLATLQKLQAVLAGTAERFSPAFLSTTLNLFSPTSRMRSRFQLSCCLRLISKTGQLQYLRVRFPTPGDNIVAQQQNPGRRTFLQAAGAGLFAAQSLTAQSSGNRIRIGQIGTGHAHATKLSVYRASAEYEVVGLVEPDPQLQAHAREHAAYRDLPLMSQEQLLSTPGLQAVLVETHVRDSLNAAEACVNAGKHVHLDKPAGESLPQFERILNAADKAGLMLQMGYMYRYNPAVVMLREFLQQGWLGEVFEVHTVMSKVVPTAARKQLAEYPGGIMFELGCHILDLVIGILGTPDHVHPFVRGPLPDTDQLRDNMLAVLEYERATATVRSSALEVDGGRSGSPARRQAS